MCVGTAIVSIPLEPDPYEKDLLIQFFHALAKVYPCKTCRDSYGRFLQTEPPDNVPNLFVWLWELKNKVNHKLGRDGPTLPLPLEKFDKRLRALSCFSAADQVWDLLCIFALNYPDNNNSSTISPEVIEQRKAYFQILAAMATFLGKLPTHRSMAPYIDPMQLTARDLSGRAPFVEWIVSQRCQWAAITGSVCYGLEETYSRYGSKGVTHADESDGYTCPNPALLPSSSTST